MGLPRSSKALTDENEIRKSATARGLVNYQLLSKYALSEELTRLQQRLNLN